MLLVVSRFPVSRPFLTNLPSLPLSQTPLSTSSVPVGLGSFLDSVPNHPCQPPTAAGPSSATCRDRTRNQLFDPGAPQGKSLTSFSHDSGNFVSYSISLNWSTILLSTMWVSFLSQSKISLENSPTFFS